MLESILAQKDYVIEYTRNETNESIECLRSEEFMKDVGSLVRVLRPLANCIAISEKADCSLGEAFKALLDFVQSLWVLDWKDDFILKGIEAFLAYFNLKKLGEDEMALMLASYFMDRRYKMDFITEEGVDLVSKCLIKIGNLTGYSPEAMDQTLVREFSNYCQQKGQLSKLAPPEQKAIDWWTQQQDIGIIRKISIRLANLKASSANLERVFSMARSIQGLIRTRFSVESLEGMTRMKLNLIDGDADNDEDGDDDDDEQEEGRDIRPSQSQRRTLSTRVSGGPSSVDTSTTSICSPSTSTQSSIAVSRVRAIETHIEDTSRMDPRIFPFFADFIKIVDFSIVKEAVEDLPTSRKASSQDVENLMKKFRATRRRDEE